VLIYEGPDMRIRTLDAGSLRLDGGAMFGVVPKPLWSKRTPADERNRITLAMRCLLVEGEGYRLLIDTGVGNKENEKFRDIYAIENAGEPTRLEDSLRDEGLEPADITHVVNTHLHFDHAGGNTRVTDDGSLQVAFPNASYVIRRGEWDFAHLDNERVRASYIPRNFDLLAEEGRVRFVEEDGDVVPGVRVVRTAGHTPYHQSVVLETAVGRFCYLADLVPTVAHVPLPWIMGYDVMPLDTLETKRGWLGRAAAERWGLIFEHDPEIAWGRAVPGEDGHDGCELADQVRDAD
jgi:glyoxylase-like metal-dependent hydrolase (beta-lactamase superfamily II)